MVTRAGCQREFSGNFSCENRHSFSPTREFKASDGRWSKADWADCSKTVMVVFVGGKIYGFAMVMMMIKLSRYSPRIDEMVHERCRQYVEAVFGTSLLDLVVRNERLWKGDFLKVKSFDYLTTREWIRKLQLHYIFECIELLFGI